MTQRDERERVQIGLRGSESLRRRLQASAEHNGYSLNGEIVWRLEASLRDEATGEVIFRDATAYATADFFVRLLRSAALLSGKDWRTDRTTMLQAIDTLRRFVEIAPEALMGKVPDRLRDATDHMAFTLLDVMLERELERQAVSREEQQGSPGAVDREAAAVRQGDDAGQDGRVFEQMIKSLESIQRLLERMQFGAGSAPPRPPTAELPSDEAR
jgi:hypothetical protein